MVLYTSLPTNGNLVYLRAGHRTVYGDGRLDYGRLDIRREEVRYIRQISRYGQAHFYLAPGA